jgi:pilus assembly protein CpaF
VRRGYVDAVDEGDGADPAQVIERLLRHELPLLAAADRHEVVRRVEAEVCGLGVIDGLWADDEVTDVLVNGPGVVWVERRGRLVPTDLRVDAGDIERVVERTLVAAGVRVDRGRPIADGRLPDGSRISVVLPPVAIDGPIVSIRRFRVERIALGAFAPPPVVELIESAVRQRRNVVVFGRTGCGKTTFLNALAASLAPSERVVTVEDAAELRLGGDHVVRLEARDTNAEGVGAVPIRALVRAALRMRPDRIVVGEVRGPEALDMVWAMSSGHDGSMSTVHASSAIDALLRLETFVSMAGLDLPPAAVRAQLASAVDVLVGLDRRPTGARIITSVHEVTGVGEPFGVRPVWTGGARVGGWSRPSRSVAA